ncbi:MAG: protoheme IX farnesyltransferase [Oligoflexia bacterium]|nr:protoheme IX farnesyltransferase [Oligoflexia bacterium]
MRFISITKPTIILGNIITSLGGYFLGASAANGAVGAEGQHNFLQLLAMVSGLSLVVASGCILNNYTDRDIDKLMERTKNRVLVTGLVSGRSAIIYALILGIVGFSLLYFYVNLLAAILALGGFFFYVVAYAWWFKRRSIYGTLIGSIAGAVPPVVGYCAVTNSFDSGAILLFLILFLWQMPHFYAICIYRLEDYTSATLPILPIKKNIHFTKLSIIAYIIAFTLTALMPTLFGYTGRAYFAVTLLMGLSWLYLGMQGLKNSQSSSDKLWSHKMFIFSIINITLLCMMISIDS